jgi:hypothetical protein
MQSEKRTNTNICVGTGVVLQLLAFYFFRSGGADAIVAGVLILISIPLVVAGCMHYAEGKGHSKWVGLVGLAGILGLIVLIVLPDQEEQGADPRLQLRKVVGLISLVPGFGLAVFGGWLNGSIKNATDEQRLGLWPPACMLLGFCIVVVSLLLLIGKSHHKSKQEGKGDATPRP